MQAAATARGMRLRPHAKTHKSPDARARCRSRAARSASAAPSSARRRSSPTPASTTSGCPIRSIPSTPTACSRCSIARGSRSSSTISTVARGWSEAMRARGREVDVLVKVDVGFHRCGIDPRGAGAAELVARGRRAARPALPRAAQPRRPRLRRRVGRARWRRSPPHEAQTLTTPARPTSGGSACAVEEISVGATPTARFSCSRSGITELRPGNYIYYDRTQVGARRRDVGRLRADRAGARRQPAARRIASSSTAAARR